MGHFQLKKKRTNPFPQILRIFLNELGKNCFPLGKIEYWTHWEFCAYHRNFALRKGLVALWPLDNWTLSIQKLPLKLYYRKSCYWKFRNIHRKTTLLAPNFLIKSFIKTCNFIKKRLQHRYFPVIAWWTFKSSHPEVFFAKAGLKKFAELTGTFCAGVSFY